MTTHSESIYETRSYIDTVGRDVIEYIHVGGPVSDAFPRFIGRADMPKACTDGTQRIPLTTVLNADSVEAAFVIFDQALQAEAIRMNERINQAAVRASLTAGVTQNKSKIIV